MVSTAREWLHRVEGRHFGRWRLAMLFSMKAPFQHHSHKLDSRFCRSLALSILQFLLFYYERLTHN
jgi:hypothetical protein